MKRLIMLIIFGGMYATGFSQIPGVNTTPSDHFVSFDGSWGWRFKTNVPLIISTLGVSNEATNVLNSAH